MKANSWVRIACVTLTFWAAGAGWGRDAVPCTAHNFEAGLYFGESYGLDRFRPMIGGNVAYGLSCRLYPFVEASYMPGILRTNNVGDAASPSYRQFSLNMTDVHTGMHFRIPIPEFPIMPYVVGGFGLIRQAKGTATFVNVSSFGQVDRQTVTVPSSVSPAFEFGGGLRVFFNDRFALRVEVKGFKPTSAPAPLEPRVFYRFAIGPVFQIR